LPRGLSRDESAAYVGVGVTLFDRAVKDRTMPEPFRLYGRVLWDVRDLDDAVDRLKGKAGGAPKLRFAV
jgi:predicted DNA-binding transcriptional regulator AlpA